MKRTQKAAFGAFSDEETISATDDAYGTSGRKKTKRTRKSGTRTADVREKNKKRTAELTKLEAVASPVIKYLIENVHGFPFNTSSELLSDNNITFRHLNCKYLNYDAVKDLIEDHDILIIKSPMGSGKTTLFKKLIAQTDSYMIVSSRKSYSYFMCSELPELVNYRDISGSISADEHPKAIIQVQSLRRIRKITQETTHAQWDCAYVDEPNGVFGEILSGVSTADERRKNANYLRKVVSNVPFVMSTDAGLAPWHVNVIRKHMLSNLKRRRIACVINDYKPQTHSIRVFDGCLLRPSLYSKSFLPALKRVCGEEIGTFMDIEQFFTGRQGSAAEDVFTSYVTRANAKESNDGGFTGAAKDIIQYLSHILINTDENAVVVCNTKKMATLVYHYVKKLLKGKRYKESGVLLLTGDTDAESKKLFMRDPATELKHKRCLVHTTMVNVGFDMNFEWCKQVFVLVDYISRKHTPALTDLFQCIGRSRRADTINLYIANRRVAPSDNLLGKGGYRGANSGFFVTDHLNMVVDGECSQNSVWSPENAFSRTFKNAQYKLLFQSLPDSESMESAIHNFRKAEKCLNDSPRAFSDALIYLLSQTLQKQDEKVQYLGPCWVDEHKFFTCQFEQDKALSKCQSVFRRRIAKYTTLTLDTFKTVLNTCAGKNEKVDVLRATAEALKIFKGTFEASYGIISRLNPELLKQWAVKYRKFQFEEPAVAVDMLNFEEETIAVCIDSKDLIERVMKNLYRLNVESGLKTFEDFKHAVELTNTLLGSTDSVVNDEDTDNIFEQLTGYLVDEHEIDTDVQAAQNKICKATGLVRERNRYVLATNKTYNVDIHKMCAMMLI